MSLIQKIKLWWTAEHRANPLDWRNIKGFIQGYWRKNHDNSRHITEQIEWRKTQVDPLCAKRGSCRLCGCDMEGKVYEDRPCDGFCYPNLMSAKDWNVFKKYLKKKKLNQL